MENSEEWSKIPVGEGWPKRNVGEVIEHFGEISGFFKMRSHCVAQAGLRLLLGLQAFYHCVLLEISMC